MSALLGTHPDHVHSPPGLLRSMSITDLPNPTAVNAAVRPPEPAPIIAKSYFFHNTTSFC